MLLWWHIVMGFHFRCCNLLTTPLKILYSVSKPVGKKRRNRYDVRGIDCCRRLLQLLILVIPTETSGGYDQSHPMQLVAQIHGWSHPRMFSEMSRLRMRLFQCFSLGRKWDARDSTAMSLKRCTTPLNLLLHSLTYATSLVFGCPSVQKCFISSRTPNSSPTSGKSNRTFVQGSGYIRWF